MIGLHSVLLKGILMFTVCDLAYCLARMKKNIRIQLLSKSDDPINILIPQTFSTSSSSQVAQPLGINSPLPRRRAPAFVGSVCVRLG